MKVRIIVNTSDREVQATTSNGDIIMILPFADHINFTQPGCVYALIDVQRDGQISPALDHDLQATQERKTARRAAVGGLEVVPANYIEAVGCNNVILSDGKSRALPLTSAMSGLSRPATANNLKGILSADVYAAIAATLPIPPAAPVPIKVPAKEAIADESSKAGESNEDNEPRKDEETREPKDESRASKDDDGKSGKPESGGSKPPPIKIATPGSVKR